MNASIKMKRQAKKHTFMDWLAFLWFMIMPAMLIITVVGDLLQRFGVL